MKPHITFVALGVEDLKRSIEFYQVGLGLQRTDESEEIAFFEIGGYTAVTLPPG